MSISSTSSSNERPGLAGRLGERVEVDDDEVERGDAGGGERLAVVGAPAIGEQPGVDPRVERLHPAVEHLGEARDGGDVGDREAGVAERPGGAAGADELEAARDEAAAQVREPGLVRDGQQRAARDRGAGVDRRRVEARPAGARRRRQRPGEQGRDRRAAAAGARRRGAARGAWPRRRPGSTGTASWATIGPPSSVASTRWTVTPVTATPAASASRTACSPGNAGSSDGWTLRIRPANAARTRGPDQPQVAREDERRPARPRPACPRAPRRRRPGRGSSRSPAPPPSRAPGTRGRRTRARPRRPARPAAAAATSARRFEPLPETPTAIRRGPRAVPLTTRLRVPLAADRVAPRRPRRRPRPGRRAPRASVHRACRDRRRARRRPSRARR